MRGVFVVGIAGGTASGKTTLAHQLRNAAGPGKVQIVPLDSFYWSGQEFPEAIKTPQKNFDHPDALDFDRYCATIDSLRSLRAVEIPVYDFASHMRVGTETLSPTPLVVVEGILVLANEEVRKRLDVAIFIDLPTNIRLERRRARDVRERQRSIESVIEQWHATVIPMEVEFVAPSAAYADIVSDGTDFAQVVSRVLRSAFGANV